MVPFRERPFDNRLDRWLVQSVFFGAIFVYLAFLIRPHLIHDSFGIYVPYPQFTMDWTCFRDSWRRAAGPTQYVSAFLSQWFYYSFAGALILTAVAWLICLATNRLMRGWVAGAESSKPREVGSAVASKTQPRPPGTANALRSSGIQLWFVSLIPACAVLALYQTYYNPLAALCALAIGLWLAVTYETIAIHHRVIVRTLVFLTACLGLYYLAGNVSLLFALLVATWESRLPKKGMNMGRAANVLFRASPILVAGAMAVFSLIVPWLVGTRWLGLALDEAYSLGWPFGGGVTSDMDPLPLNVLRSLFLFPLLIVLVAAGKGVGSLFRPIGEPLGKGAWFKKVSGTVAGTARRVLRTTVPDTFLNHAGKDVCEKDSRPLFRLAGEILVLVAVVAAIHRGVRSPELESRLEMVHFARDGNWDGVLRVAQRVPASGYDCFCSHLVNRALYHTGRLGGEMFSYSQHPAGLLLLTGAVPHVPPKFWMLSEIALELGDINLAEQWAYQILEGVGDCPSALETAALICTAKKQSEAARVLLRRMQRNVIFGQRAGELLAAVGQDNPGSLSQEGAGGSRPSPPSPLSACANDWRSRAEKLRELHGTEDVAFQKCSENFVLENLLKANARNRMAFEYLMASYLLAKRPDKIVANLRRLDDFGYQEIPRHYEEAILIHASPSSLEESLSGRRISDATLQRFQAFSEAYGRCQGQDALAFEALAKDFGNTYFFYHVFGVSGVGGSR